MSDKIYDDPLMPRELEVFDLTGSRVVKAEYVKGGSDADEQVVLVFDNGLRLEVGTSEWLHVKIISSEN